MGRRKTVAVDLDGVLAEYKGGWKGVHVIGDPLPGAVAFTRHLAEFADVLVFTTRTKADFDDRPAGTTAEDLKKLVEGWLLYHGYAYHGVYAGQGKPIASAYIDDRAVVCEPQVRGLVAYEEAILRARGLCREHHS